MDIIKNKKNAAQLKLNQATQRYKCFCNYLSQIGKSTSFKLGGKLGKQII